MKVLDASGILHSDLDFSSAEYFITNSVLLEIIDDNAKIMVDQGIRQNFIKVKDPTKESIDKVTAAAKESGDYMRLSKADIDVLALALENRADIVSDDYSIQNVAASLRIKVVTTAQEGIKKQFKWEKACPACGLRYSAAFTECEVCGSKLRNVGRNVVDE